MVADGAIDDFYQFADGFFKHTLIRRSQLNVNHHRLKIYARLLIFLFRWFFIY